MTQFSDLNLSQPILQSLEDMGFKAPSPIQAKAIPLVLEGHDVIALAQTGSGKTAACAIPVADRIDTSKPHIQALIVVPTRELALQYASETQKIGKRKAISTLAVYGGASADLQEAKLNHQVHVCVATPGRLIDFIHNRLVDLSHVETFILDEADEMLSMGFYDDLEFIFQCLIHEHQTLLFSATMPKDIRQLAEQHMNQPKDVALAEQEKAPKNLEHRFCYSHFKERDKDLLRLLKEHDPQQAIIFCDSRIQSEKLSRFLKDHIKGVDYIHGGLTQDIRSMITDKFRRKKIRFLIATDVAARGLDFSGVTHVFMASLPKDHNTYVHRSGRTGRFGEKGLAITLVGSRDFNSLKYLGKHIERDIVWEGEKPHSFDKPQSKGNYRRRRPRKKSD